MIKLESNLFFVLIQLLYSFNKYPSLFLDQILMHFQKHISLFTFFIDVKYYNNFKSNMFANAYQNGPYLQVFDSKVNHQKNELYKQLCKITPINNKRYFDKEVKSYLWEFNSQNSRLNLPAGQHKQLSLNQRFLVLQIYIPVGCAWCLQIGLTDLSKTKRRINITTTSGKEESKYFSVRYPVFNLIKGCWMFLGIDILSFMDAFKGQTLRSLDNISVGSYCKIRRIFTLKQWSQWDIPKNYWMGGQIEQNLQLIEYGVDKKMEHSNISHVAQEKNSHIGQQKMSRVKSLQKNKSQQSYQVSPVQNNRKDLSIRSPEKSMLKQITKTSVAHINSKIKINTIQETTSKNNKQLNNPSIKLKAPYIQKSFKEDGLMSASESDIPFDIIESKESQNEIIEEDKWSDEEDQKLNHNKAQIKLGTIFPETLITKSNKETVTLDKKDQKQLQLIYDEMVGCYYHPETNTYYEINN